MFNNNNNRRGHIVVQLFFSIFLYSTDQPWCFLSELFKKCYVYVWGAVDYLGLFLHFNGPFCSFFSIVYPGFLSFIPPIPAFIHSNFIYSVPCLFELRVCQNCISVGNGFLKSESQQEGHPVQNGPKQPLMVQYSNICVYMSHIEICSISNISNH